MQDTDEYRDGHQNDDVRSEYDAGHGGVDLPALLTIAREATSDIAMITDAAQLITYTSASFTAMTGYEQADLLGKNCRVMQGPGTDQQTTREMRERLASGQVFDGEILNYRKDGSAFWAALKIVPLRAGAGPAITHYASVERDISNSVASWRRLEAQASHDHVTGLPNRAAAERAVDDAVRTFPRADVTVAVCLIDLDDFRIVNNTLGHAAGDVVLQQWATRILTRLRDGDVLARMGGDEFLLILKNIHRTTSHEDLMEIMDHLGKAVQHPFPVEGQQVHVGMSVGVGLVPEDGTDHQSILRSADEALYAAKKRTSRTSPWWQTAVHARAQPHRPGHAGQGNGAAKSPLGLGADLETDLERTPTDRYRTALRSGNVVVHFQPIVDLRDGSVILFEALARLETPGGHITSPDKFLPHLGAHDLRFLFDHVLEQGLALIAGWERPGLRPNVAVNLPPEILHDKDLAESIKDALHAHGIEPGGLGLELLETQTLTLETQRTALQQLADTGVRLAMDDLGSGFSSLQRLATFPFSAIKLDRGLFLHAHDKPLEALSIMATLVQMGRDLEMTVVVEGLEDEALTEAATIFGAQLGQGYYFARPMPAKDCRPWAESFETSLHDMPIQTPLGALAYHWQFARLAAPHPLDLECCPLTHFIRSFTHDTPVDTDTNREATLETALIIATDTHTPTDADTDTEAAEVWHALQHSPQGMHPTASKLLIGWLTRL